MGNIYTIKENVTNSYNRASTFCRNMFTSTQGTYYPNMYPDDLISEEDYTKYADRNNKIVIVKKNNSQLPKEKEEGLLEDASKEFALQNLSVSENESNSLLVMESSV